MNSEFKQPQREQLLAWALLLLLVVLVREPIKVHAGLEPEEDIQRLLEEAGGIAQMLGPQSKPDALVEIAMIYAKAGKKEGAETILRMAKSHLLQLDPQEYNRFIFLSDRGSWPISKLINVASAYKELGNQDEAASILGLAAKTAEERVSDIEVKVFTLQDIAEAQIKWGNAAGAKRTLQRALETAELVEGVKGKKKGGGFFPHDAEIKALTIEHLSTLVATAVSSAFLEVGDNESATAILDQLLATFKGLPKNSSALRALAVAQAKMGRLKEAEVAIDKLLQMSSRGFNFADDQFKIDGLMMVAEALGKMGKKEIATGYIDRGLKFAQTKATEPMKQDYSIALTRISMAQVNLGNFKESIQTAAMIPDEAQRNETLNLIAAHQILAGDLQGALKTAPGNRQAYFLIEAAALQAKRGDVAEALETIEEPVPRDEFDEPTVRHMKAPALRTIAAAWVKNGGRKEALAWARNQTSGIEKVYALLGVVDGLLSSKSK